MLQTTWSTFEFIRLGCIHECTVLYWVAPLNDWLTDHVSRPSFNMYRRKERWPVWTSTFPMIILYQRPLQDYETIGHPRRITFELFKSLDGQAGLLADRNGVTIWAERMILRRELTRAHWIQLVCYDINANLIFARSRHELLLVTQMVAPNSIPWLELASSCSTVGSSMSLVLISNQLPYQHSGGRPWQCIKLGLTSCWFNQSHSQDK